MNEPTCGSWKIVEGKIVIESIDNNLFQTPTRSPKLSETCAD